MCIFANNAPGPHMCTSNGVIRSALFAILLDVKS